MADLSAIHTEYRTKAESLIPECRQVASLIRRQSARVAKALKIIQVLSVVVGVAGVAANFPIVAVAIGTTGVGLASFVTAFALIASAVWYAVIGSDTPERYIDHSKYIGSYADRLEEVLCDSKLAESVRSARLQELIRLAAWNLSDAKDKWPWIERKLTVTSQITSG